MLQRLTERFGDGILNDDNTLNRRALAAVAFATKENTEALNQITHPFIIALVERDIQQYENVILDAPTLFESGLSKKCDHIIAVLADKGIRTNRIVSRDNLTQQQLDDRHKGAKPDEITPVCRLRFSCAAGKDGRQSWRCIRYCWLMCLTAQEGGAVCSMKYVG